MKKVTSSLFFVLVVGILVSCATFGSSLPPLHVAAQDGNINRVIRLVEGGADVNERSFGHSALERAATRGHFEVVEFLLSINASDPQRAFQNALRNNHANIARLIIDGGHIDVNFNAQSFNSILNDNQVPFNQRMQMVRDIAGDILNTPFLLALVNREHYQQTIDFFNINLTDIVDEYGNSILHVAAMRNNVDLVRYLLENNFYVNTLDNNNHTALFYSITSFGPLINWNDPIIEDDTTARINYVSDMPQFRDPNELRRRQAEIGIMLLNAGINVNQQNEFGWTVLHFASASFPVGPIEVLNERGADANLRTNFGRNASDIFALRN